ncbi:hypothetical protein ABZU09_07610 [Lactobacillus mulieris]|uniref:hypothetical protein n=1 Tax=Lactobacillus mulieris TaxID=2508708 RepID=UPI000555904F|nr:hypothetical protein [Lactobacillus mulieris]KAA9244564.1 hypothetical protein F6I33_03695 [Lactobacillus jensenii]TRT36681.1 hypothetical protein ETI26_04875 [Lactobacillus sp. c10Ua232AE]KAA9370279.1 hypothetical protein F6I25_00025 [Lactobacillus jensenii]KAA9371361.1 hypothetical protein F6I07_06520 [Lactobacillus jensenii]MCF1846493.1 hypothetical protein [Lactobacillus mulieris]
MLITGAYATPDTASSLAAVVWVAGVSLLSVFVGVVDLADSVNLTSKNLPGTHCLSVPKR